MSPELVSLRAGGVRFVPVLHGHFELAIEVRRAFFELKPEVVAVEYPPSFEAAIRRGVARLPNLSVVLAPEPDGSYLYLPIEPQDPGIEAVRLALEQDLPLAFIDADVAGYALNREAFPDPHAIRLVGFESWVSALLEGASRLEHSPQDEFREQHMAAELQELARSHDRVLAVLGLVHARRVRDRVAGPALGRPFRRPLAREGVRVANLAEKSSREVLSDHGYIATAWERARGTPLPPAREPNPTLLAFPLGGARARTGTAATDATAAPRDAAGELPVRKLEDLDRNRLNLDLVKSAARRYLGQGVGRLSATELRNLFRFTRNWAMLEGRLLPRLYELVVGARSVADDNFAYEVWDLGSHYPWQEVDPDLSTVEISAEHLRLDGKLLRFRRKVGPLQRVPHALRKRPDWRPTEWKERWRGLSVCSHPPEDIVVEGFGSHLQRRALTALAEEGSRVEPFSTSLLDGIDLRETIRNWHREQRLWVRESRPVRGRVGAVVLIFDGDEPGAAGSEERYPWKLTWLGEHDQESDMAFYATAPGETLVGPGISRCEYGGFLMSWPPRRMFDIWEDPTFQATPSKAERLLFAALAYSQERFVAYIAAKPPRPAWRGLAQRLDRKIVYLPIGQFSPPLLRRIRLFHVLDGHHVRRYAGDYLR